MVMVGTMGGIIVQIFAIIHIKVLQNLIHTIQ
jgi:hypothetical protein